jgi:hypothetical protein
LTVIYRSGQVDLQDNPDAGLLVMHRVDEASAAAQVV